MEKNKRLKLIPRDLRAYEIADTLNYVYSIYSFPNSQIL